MSSSGREPNVSVTVKRGADRRLQRSGDCAPIKVYVEYTESSAEIGTGEYTRVRHSARFRYDVEDGMARLHKVKEIKGDDVSSPWTGFGFLRCVAAAEQAVSNLDGVERVERGETTLGEHLQKGREAVPSGITDRVEEMPELRLEKEGV